MRSILSEVYLKGLIAMTATPNSYEHIQHIHVTCVY